MMDLDQSYRVAEQICRSSGSSFYRSFQFLKPDRRRAMHALYALARLADNATDDPTASGGWHQATWRAFLRRLGPSSIEPAVTDSIDLERLPEALRAMEPALADTVERYRIPIDMLDALIEGMDMDARGESIATWNELRDYGFRVASSVGICCTAIWTDGKPFARDEPLWHSAVDCGIAFQLTNILRDLREDAARSRVYLPLEDLERFGLSRGQWLAFLGPEGDRTKLAGSSWLDLHRVQTERARALFARGWQLHRSLEPDSFRMFSLMWHTYRALLEEIARDPERSLRLRVGLPTNTKLSLAATHCFTPLLVRAAAVSDSETRGFEQVAAPKLPEGRPRVAVVGGGLAGMNASLALARHGCDVVMFEAKSRLGGRAGSFTDPVTGQAVDYCQHVGMQCCAELRRWIASTRSADAWRMSDTLHFVSKAGKPMTVRAWPLPAPLHLSGLILRWPDLSFVDRVRVGLGLACLLSSRSSEDFDGAQAVPWLETHFQNRRTIDRFWGTILVSALGEQVDRVAMGPVRKVLVDGFAATRDAFHLLVPAQPLSRLMDEAGKRALSELGVEIRTGSPVHALERDVAGAWSIPGGHDARFDAVVLAVPWHRIGPLLKNAELSDASRHAVERAGLLESSPITGVHTWWDRPWLTQPHAIAIDRLCQWVFPGPDASSGPVAAGETYYQVVISGSRQLPRGKPDAILDAVEADLKELFPEAKNAKLLRGKVVTDPQSVFSVSPGHASGRLSAGALAREAIFLGGDWTDTAWPATMEGALRSGLLAAQELLMAVGRPAQLMA